MIQWNLMCFIHCIYSSSKKSPASSGLLLLKLRQEANSVLTCCLQTALHYKGAQRHFTGCDMSVRESSIFISLFAIIVCFPYHKYFPQRYCFLLDSLVIQVNSFGHTGHFVMVFYVLEGMKMLCRDHIMS